MLSLNEISSSNSELVRQSESVLTKQSHHFCLTFNEFSCHFFYLVFGISLSSLIFANLYPKSWIAELLRMRKKKCPALT